MGLKDRLLAPLAGQLGHPRGLVGRYVTSMLNRTNQVPITAAIDALAPAPGQVVADVGFGGGLGLDLLLDVVGGAGKVYGFDISRVAVEQTGRRRRKAVADGRLVVREASMEQLPLGDGALDGLITVNTIYFIPELRPAFAELARVLSSTGRLVVGLGDPDAMARMPVTASGFRLRPVTEVETALAEAGFRVVNHRRLNRGDLVFHLLVAAPATPDQQRMPERQG